MGFIGNQPALSYTSFAVQHFTTSATTSYTLNYPVANENEIRLVINNVVQQPGSSYAYTASGTSLTLSEATSATDTMYAVFLGKAIQTVNPPVGSIDNTMLSSSIITGQTAETSIDGADSVLIYDNSASALRKMTRTNFVAGVGATNTPAFLATRESSQTISDSTTTKIQFNTEVFDTDSCYDNATNYRFTPNKAGKYLFFVKFMLANTAEPVQVLCTLKKNGSITYEGYRQTANGSEVDVTCHQILEANGSTDYFEAFVFHQAGSNKDIYGNTEQRTHFGGFFITT